MTTLKDCHDCFYVPGSLYIIDMVNPKTGLTFYFGKSLEDVREKEPEAQFMSFDEAFEQIEAAQRAAFVRPVSESTKDEFWHMLEVLPPLGWKTAKGVESFKMCEMTTGTLTNIYARCGDRYFKLCDDVTLSAEAIADRVGEYITQRKKVDVAW